MKIKKSRSECVKMSSTRIRFLRAGRTFRRLECYPQIFTAAAARPRRTDCNDTGHHVKLQSILQHTHRHKNQPFMCTELSENRALSMWQCYKNIFFLVFGGFFPAYLSHLRVSNQTICNIRQSNPNKERLKTCRPQ